MNHRPSNNFYILIQIWLLRVRFNHRRPKPLMALWFSILNTSRISIMIFHNKWHNLKSSHLLIVDPSVQGRVPSIIPLEVAWANFPKRIKHSFTNDEKAEGRPKWATREPDKTAALLLMIWKWQNMPDNFTKTAKADRLSREEMVEDFKHRWILGLSKSIKIRFRVRREAKILISVISWLPEIKW